MRIELKLGEYDWMATRLTPRKYYPPSATATKSFTSNEPLPADGGVSRFDPASIQIPGIEGFGVEISRYGAERTLVLRVAIANPFTNSARGMAKRSLARWNDTFNTWDIPILSQSKGKALKETWVWIEDCFFELPWQTETLELHWRYLLSDQSLEALKRKIRFINGFWDIGAIDFQPNSMDLVYSHLSREQIEAVAIATFRELRPHSEWEPQSECSQNRLSVNYLRHRQSAYHVMLQSQKPYLDVFEAINQAIGKTYPWLQPEAKRQIQMKQRGHHA